MGTLIFASSSGKGPKNGLSLFGSKLGNLKEVLMIASFVESFSAKVRDLLIFFLKPGTLILFPLTNDVEAPAVEVLIRYLSFVISI